MTPEFLASMGAILISLAASYLPGFAGRYSELSPNNKRLSMLALMAVTALVSFGITCSGYAELFGITLQCDRVGAVGLFRAFIAAVIANQSAYSVSPRTDQ